MTNFAASTIDAPMTDENFEELLAESLGEDDRFEGKVLSGTIIRVDGDVAVIDVGLKSEGRVPLKEFGQGKEGDLSAGDVVDVFIERFEDRDGMIRLSREKARREEAWTLLEKSFEATERVNGVIFGRVKGGFIVDLQGAVAFLPGSQVDIRPVRDIAPLMGTPQPFQILKMDRARNNIVVSRRAVLEETRAEARAELISGLKEGDILEGVVKNITDYGAFVDLGGVDGLLHVTDIAWRRINHPSEALQVGQTVKVQVIRFNSETQRISLGMKQLESDPWDGIAAKYPVGAKFTGRVTNITDYGAFVELEPGVEGLVHVSEMSWTKKNIHPGKIVSTSQEVEVMVLDTDSEKRRISLGLKQCGNNPWDAFLAETPIGSVVEGEIKNITEFGLFIGLQGDIDGMAHLSDLSWDKPGEEAIAEYNKGDVVKAKVLDVDVEKERISLGIKQLTEDPFEGTLSSLKRGAIVTCTVTKIVDNGIEVNVDGMPGFIRKAELSRDRSEQRPDRFATGEKVDAKITQIDSASRRLTLSVKALEVADEKQALADFGSSDSGASLGDILGAALQERKAAAEEAAAKDDGEGDKS
ncbi:30S ribosomal protein S1 [Varunaivibrio sulfuroxidans]|uniref:Small ribosomal subunit protein bS1 n=1 Tax=Varunaivibrio sulfuroxidans TaxID=1773489 RepID=A0A4R3J9F7_9PROT|nr:30S ribosomal protein S1 [Varunaivibrio sulfuroxidans]TCS61626.1 SSU ribosomal protein S1P [Varunaivibrio sulfuroxidans]WES29501.1 30S ribosomal protein S1 [Varunaivibrio sulfuroxidans]